MSRLAAAGGLAIAACVCGLLFSSAASARQATDEVVVTGVRSSNHIKFTAMGSPFKSISFSGGSNWHFTAVSGANWTCDLTPTDGGAYCASTTAATSTPSTRLSAAQLRRS